MKKKVCIIGTASTMLKTPWDDKSFDFWACSPVITHPGMEKKKFNLLFELHGENYYLNEKILERLNKVTCPILMKKKVDKIKTSEKLDFEKMIEFFNGRKYYTSTISFMIAYAIMQGYSEIHLYGVHMSASEEYGHQRQACEYWLGVAEGRGIKIYVPEESEILHISYVYGYETENDVVAQARIRRSGLLMGAEEYEQKKINKIIELNQNVGKYSVQPDEELEKIIERNKHEIKALQTQIDKNLGAVSEDEHWIRRYSYSGKLLEAKE